MMRIEWGIPQEDDLGERWRRGFDLYTPTIEEELRSGSLFLWAISKSCFFEIIFLPAARSCFGGFVVDGCIQIGFKALWH